MTFTHQPTTAARSPHNPSVWPCLIVDGPVSGPWVCLSHLRRRLIVLGWERSYISDRPRANHATGGWREEHWVDPLLHPVPGSLLLDRLQPIAPPPGYEDMTRIPDWAGHMARCDWHQDASEWRLTIPKIWDHATKAPEEVVA